MQRSKYQSKELSKLICEPINKLQEIKSLKWRDWIAVKIDDNKWKLKEMSADSK